MKTLPEHTSQDTGPENTRKAILGLEWAVGIIVAILIVYLHVTFMQNAGALWRDEVSRLNLATMPSLADVWASMEYDAYPIFSPLLIRLWVGRDLVATDSSLRVFGFLAGLSIFGALWLSARLQGRSLPLLSMVLFGLAPLAIRTGDAVGQYGMGVFLIILTFGLIWKVVESPDPRWIFAATVGAVLSVQCLYTNALLLFAICLGGMVVTIGNAMWRRAAILVGIGTAAALSLLPYLGMVRRSGDWTVLVKSSNTFELSWKVLSVQALGSSGHFIPWIWVGLFFLGIFIAIYRIFRKSNAAASRKERDMTLFFATVMVATAVEFFLFYRIMNVYPPPWYFFYPMAIVAVCLDAIFGRNKDLWSVCRIALTVLIVGLTFSTIWHKVHIRQTNIDFIAAELEGSATKGDMILINPWYAGVTFQRYYKGEVPWMTIPPIEDLKIHRYDLLKKKMASPDPLQPVLAGIEKTLRAGKRLWLVGDFYRPREGQAPPVVPPAPGGPYGWNSRPYLQSWLFQAEYFINSNALRYKQLLTSSDEPISPYEKYSLVMVEGWQHY